MSPRPLRPAPASAFPADALTRRILNRAGVAFLLDLISLARNGRHPLDALLLSVTIQANVAQVAAQADLQVRHAAADAPPGDELRRPVSMNALATSLRLPFESVRRRIHNLAAAGLCQVSAEGVVVPTAILASPEYLTQAFAGYERIRAFHRELVGLGALRDLPQPTVDLGDGIVPVRAVARLVTDYVLRSVDVAQAAFGDVITCLVLLEVFRCNTEHLGRAPEPEDQLGAYGALDDAHRRPVKVTVLSRRLGLPAETVRRYAAAMVERGSLIRTPEGLVAPAEGLMRMNVVTFVTENERHLRRLFANLAQLGVLAIWEKLDPA